MIRLVPRIMPSTRESAALRNAGSSGGGGPAASIRSRRSAAGFSFARSQKIWRSIIDVVSGVEPDPVAAGCSRAERTTSNVPSGCDREVVDLDERHHAAAALRVRARIDTQREVVRVAARAGEAVLVGSREHRVVVQVVGVVPAELEPAAEAHRERRVRGVAALDDQLERGAQHMREIAVALGEIERRLRRAGAEDLLAGGFEAAAEFGPDIRLHGGVGCPIGG